jgi:hypothetical protein
MNHRSCALVAMLALLPVATTSAEPVQAGLEYTIYIAAPAMKSECEALTPGFGGRFDALFGPWAERNSRQIEATKQQMLASGKFGATEAELKAALEKMVHEAFEADSPGDRKVGCEAILTDLARMETNPVPDDDAAAKTD